MGRDERLVNFARLTASNGEGITLFGKRVVLALATKTGSQKNVAQSTELIKHV
jgi:hypothetical protein